MTLSEIKDQVAKEAKYSSWDDVEEWVIDQTSPVLVAQVLTSLMSRVSKLYAESALKEAAEKATVEYDGNMEVVVNKESITNIPLD